MTEGISTVIKQSDDFAKRWSMAERDARAILAHSHAIVTVATYLAAGSNDQNRLFHKLCDHIATHWNRENPGLRTTPEQVKRDLKVEFGPITTEYSPVSGKRQARIVSWSQYTKVQRSDLINNTLAWMAENRIPDLPREEW